MILDVLRGHAVGSLNLRSLVPWNMDAAKRHDIGARILAEINVTLRLERSVVDSAGLILAQYFRVT